jgi:hypothetical protein
MPACYAQFLCCAHILDLHVPLVCLEACQPFGAYSTIGVAHCLCCSPASSTPLGLDCALLLLCTTCCPHGLYSFGPAHTMTVMIT